VSPQPVTAEPQPGSAGGAGAPRHIAIIMDGNGRWAKARGLPRVAGHRQGAEAARAVLRAAGEAGVECLTLYAFSSENWRRPETEISDLMGLLRFYIGAELNALHREGIRLKILGDHSAFPADVAKAGRLCGGEDRRQPADDARHRSQLRRAGRTGPCNEAARGPRCSWRDPADAIDEACIEAALDTADLPPLDLLIRTSGEQRLSNFLLWQSAYAELAVRRYALARFRRRCLALGACGIRQPRTALRRSFEMSKAPAANSDLPTRFAAAVAMIAVAVVAVYVGGWLFRALVLVAAALMLIEWGDMHKVARRWSYAGVLLLAANLLIVPEVLFPVEE
jgi:undecaprenyl diphosphate synthase